MLHCTDTTFRLHPKGQNSRNLRYLRSSCVDSLHLSASQKKKKKDNVLETYSTYAIVTLIMTTFRFHKKGRSSRNLQYLRSCCVNSDHFSDSPKRTLFSLLAALCLRNKTGSQQKVRRVVSTRVPEISCILYFLVVTVGTFPGLLWRELLMRGQFFGW